MPSALMNGERGAVAPVSALKLYRRGVKHMRGEWSGLESYVSVDENGCTYENDSLSVPVCLAKNPFFSLQLGITELSGPAGVGKTQMALSLCADCVQPAHNPLETHTMKKAVFIQLGGSSRFLQTASRRIEQMLLSRLDTDHPKLSAEAKNEQVHHCLTRILVHWVCNSEELMQVLQTSLPALLRHNPTTSVVVLDGIANLFRLVEKHEQQANGNPWHDRAVTFFRISNLCKELSSRFRVPFLILNECTSRIGSDANRYQQTVLLEPALGLAWAQCVNASFFVRRAPTLVSNHCTEKNSSENRCKPSSQKACHRIVQCLRAPNISSDHSTARFWINRSGVSLV